MAGLKIVTRKMVTFQDENEEFSNVYYFGDGGGIGSPGEAVGTSLVNEVIAAEKLIFSTQVRFLGGQAYDMPLIGSEYGDALSVVELAATGNQGAVAHVVGMYRECAIDIKWLLGGRRYLRSMLHTCALHGLNPDGANAQIYANLSAAIKNFAQDMLDDGWAGGMARINPSGERPTAFEINPTLEHRQFHRYRRRSAGLLG